MYVCMYMCIDVVVLIVISGKYRIYYWNKVSRSQRSGKVHATNALRGRLQWRFERVPPAKMPRMYLFVYPYGRP